MNNAPSFLSTMPDVNKFGTEMSGLLQQQQKSQEPIKKAMSANVERMRTIEGSVSSLPQPPVPKLSDLPKPPDQHMKDPVEALSGMGAILGIFGSLLTRQPLTAALNAGAAAMNAYHAGDMQKLALEKKNFDEHLKTAMDQNNKEIEQYRMAMEHYGGDINKAQWDLHAIEAENKNMLGINLLDNKNLEEYMKLKMNLFSAGAKASQAGAMLSLKAQEAAEKMQQAEKKKQESMPNPETIAALARTFMITGKIPPLGMGSPELRAALFNSAKKQQDEAGWTNEHMAILPFSIHAQAQTLNEMVSWTANLEKYEMAAKSNMKVMLDYAKKVGPGDIKLLNKALLAGKREFGNTDADAYVLAFEGVRRDYSRVMSGPKSNAQLHAANLKKADNVLSEFSSIPQLEEDFIAMTKDMDNQSGASMDMVKKLTFNMEAMGQNQPVEKPNTDNESLLNKYR